MPASALVLFSAGQDSATCLAWALSRYEVVETIGFSYRQRHRVELDQRPLLRQRIAALGLGGALGEDRVVDISGYGALAESALTTEAAIVMAEDGLPSTFVPGRNLVFFSIAAAHAYRRGAEALIGGMCETDYSGYPDCRRESLDAMERALSLGLGRALRIETPLMYKTKAQTWTLALELGGAALVELIVEHSHTCYEGDREHRHVWGYGCGICPACVLRAKGWAAFAS